MFLLRLLSRYRMVMVLAVGALLMVVMRSQLSLQGWQTYSPYVLIGWLILMVAVNSIRVRRKS